MQRLISLLAVLGFLIVTLFATSTNANEQQEKHDFIKHIKSCHAYYYNELNPESEFVVPVQLAVGVAIHESNWGNSRFALEGYNYYGIRTSSNDPDEYMVPKNAPNVKVAKYLHNCNSTIAFLDLMVGSGHYNEAMNMIKNSDKDHLPWIEILKSINVKYSVSENWPGKIAFIIKSLKS
jgi:hypothetical protein